MHDHVSGSTIAAVGIFLWIPFALGLFVGHRGTGAIPAVLEFIGMTWLGMLFLAFVCLLAVDVITAFGLLFAKQVQMLRGMALMTATARSAITLVQGLEQQVAILRRISAPLEANHC